MNNVTLVGRLTKDPVGNPGEKAYAQFTVACDRPFKREGQPTADFISCKAFGKTAEIVMKYFEQGKKIGLQGSIQTGSYEKDGRTIYTTEVIADRVEFVESKKEGAENNGFTTFGEEEMPF